MSELAPCGTRSAYKRHRRHGEEACGPCREANRAENEKYRPQYNEKRRERRRLEGKPQRAPKTKREPEVVELPRVVQGPEGMGPCVMPENGFVWDPRRDGETAQQARKRHRTAKAICMTACPVFSWCQQEFASAGGVTAGASA